MIAERTFDVVNSLGLHARAAAKLVGEANRFDSDVYLVKDGEEVNGKSIMGVLTLAAGQGSRITVRCEGEDAEECLQALEALFERGFDED